MKKNLGFALLILSAHVCIAQEKDSTFQLGFGLVPGVLVTGGSGSTYSFGVELQGENHFFKTLFWVFFSGINNDIRFGRASVCRLSTAAGRAKILYLQGPVRGCRCRVRHSICQRRKRRRIQLSSASRSRSEDNADHSWLQCIGKKWLHERFP